MYVWKILPGCWPESVTETCSKFPALATPAQEKLTGVHFTIWKVFLKYSVQQRGCGHPNLVRGQKSGSLLGSNWKSRWPSPQLPLSVYAHDLGTPWCWLSLFHEFPLASYTSYWCFSNAPDVSAWDAYCKPAGTDICLLAMSVFWVLLHHLLPLSTG